MIQSQFGISPQQLQSIVQQYHSNMQQQQAMADQQVCLT
jgi:hypothetical protein